MCNYQNGTKRALFYKRWNTVSKSESDWQPKWLLQELLSKKWIPGIEGVVLTVSHEVRNPTGVYVRKPILNYSKYGVEAYSYSDATFAVPKQS